MGEWHGNCAKCGHYLSFKDGPSKDGKYTFTCYQCGANTRRAAVPAQFESEYVDRLIHCGNRMREMICALCATDPNFEKIDKQEPLSGWRALVRLREATEG